MFIHPSFESVWLLPFFTIINNAFINIHAEAFGWAYTFIYLEWDYENSMFNILGNCVIAVPFDIPIRNILGFQLNHIFAHHFI